MKGILTVTVMFILSGFLATAIAQSFEGTTKGCVLRDVKPVQEGFKATQENGPWIEQKKGRNLTSCLLGVIQQTQKPWWQALYKFSAEPSMRIQCNNASRDFFETGVGNECERN